MRLLACLLLLCLGLAACTDTETGPRESRGFPIMVRDGDRVLLWLLTRQEEVRQVRLGTGRNATYKTETLFHFDLVAIDPATAQPAWTRRLRTLGDPERRAGMASRVVGSSASGRWLGQDGGLVWMFLVDEPVALRAADGEPVLDLAGLEARHPALAGRLAREDGFYGFDGGLVAKTADAERLRFAGPDVVLQPYTPPPPPPAPELWEPGKPKPRIEPLRPLGDAPARHLVRPGGWLGLYSEKEVADAINDEFGDHHAFPYSIQDEGAEARRRFWTITVAEAERFEERFPRLVSAAPVADAPTFLRGRFLKDLATGEPLRLQAPDGMAVWHRTRIDIDGRLALTRLDEALGTVWSTPLPISEGGTANPVRYWLVDGHVLVQGDGLSEVEFRQVREEWLASVRLSDGRLSAWSVTREAPLR